MNDDRVMKVNLSEIDKKSFNIRPVFLNNEVLFLVHAIKVKTEKFGGQVIFMGPKWDRTNLHFRSSMWNADGKLVSAGFKKFFNGPHGGITAEKEEVIPSPKDIRGCNIFEKLDGSLFIVSKYKGKLIVRTRGTSTVEDLPTGHELLIFQEKYPKVFDNELINSEQCSTLYEWTSPENRIVISYGREPELKLVGIVTHADYSLVRQVALDDVAFHLGVGRPKQLTHFTSIEEMVESARGLIGAEGYCVYFNNDQNITKWKSDWYLAMHRMKQALGSMEELLDFYIIMGLPKYSVFMDYIEKAHDYETMLASRSNASKLCEAAKEVEKILDHMKKFAESVKNLSRRDAAIAIQQAYGTTNRAGYVFSFLDNKELKPEALKKLFFQITKK